MTNVTIHVVRATWFRQSSNCVHRHVQKNRSWLTNHVVNQKLNVNNWFNNIFSSNKTDYFVLQNGPLKEGLTLSINFLYWNNNWNTMKTNVILSTPFEALLSTVSRCSERFVIWNNKVEVFTLLVIEDSTDEVPVPSIPFTPMGGSVPLPILPPGSYCNLGNSACL